MEITNSYTLIKQPQPEDIMNDIGASFWLQAQVSSLIMGNERDVLKSLKDTEILHAMAKKKHEDVTDAWKWALAHSDGGDKL